MTAGKGMDRDQLVRAVAELIAGLAVPVSMEMPLGRAGVAWTALHSDLAVFGWATAEEYETAIRGKLGLPALAPAPAQEPA
jgi:hypothetical protein